MEPFDAGVFANTYKTKTGQSIWAFLNESRTILQMKTATALGRPAVEGIEEPLLGEFGKEVLEDRTKQMIGKMVRQIMERTGYVIDQQNVKIANGAPFSRATRYKRKDAMTFHAHRSSRDSRKIALTADKEGQTLPKDENWVYWKSFESGLRARIAFDLEDEEQALENISKTGYHIYHMKKILSKAR